MTDWSYDGATGPDHWADLDPAWGIARLGVRQSPIDLAGAVVDRDVVLELHYDDVRLTDVTNDGHTLQVGVTPGGTLELAPRRWTLRGLHFHAPSEHLIDGRALDMELHLVHADDAGQLAVLGVVARVAGGPEPLRAVFDAAVSGADRIHPVGGDGILIDDVLPADRTRWFAYAGSLTTPPFTEQVQWVVLEQPIDVSESDVATMRRLFGPNARPVQPKQGRRVVSSG